LAFKNE